MAECTNRSIEAGHWEKVNNGLVSPDIIKSSRALSVTAVLVDPFEPETVYASTLAGFIRRRMAGRPWVRIGQSLLDQMLFSMILDRTKKGVIYLGGREGVHRSEDGGDDMGHAEQGFYDAQYPITRAESDRSGRVLCGHEREWFV